MHDYTHTVFVWLTFRLKFIDPLKKLTNTFLAKIKANKNGSQHFVFKMFD